MVFYYLYVTCLFLVAVQLASSSTIRTKRQSDRDSDELDDRYGFDRNPQFQGQWQNQFPGNNRFPDQQQFPGQNQFPGPIPFPRPGQWQGQFNGQGQNQFPEPGQQRFPNNQGQNQPSGQGQNQTSNQGQDQNASGTTTQSSAVQTCVRACPVTAEYNPVCGTNNVQYNNPSHLYCAQNCGISVNLLRTGACPAATTTAAPTSPSN